MSWYRWLYTHLTPWWKRPWTYVYRDIWHNLEILMQFQWFWTAVLVLWLLGISIPLKMLIIFWVIYIIGYINGHFFWGTEWRKEEGTS